MANFFTPGLPPSVENGHVNFLPVNYSSKVGTWVFNSSSYQYYYLNGYIYNSSNAQFDAVTYTTHMNAGTYDLRIWTVKDIGHGIMRLKINGVEVSSFDAYSPTQIWNVLWSDSGIVIPTSGVKNLQIIVEDRNELAGGWFMIVSFMTLWRTA